MRPVDPQFEFELIGFGADLNLSLSDQDETTILFEGLFAQEGKVPLEVMVSVDLEPLVSDYRSHDVTPYSDRVYIIRPELGTSAVTFEGEDFLLVLPALPGGIERLAPAKGTSRGFDHHMVAWITSRLLESYGPLEEAAACDPCWIWLSLQSDGWGLATGQRNEQGGCPPLPHPLKPELEQEQRPIVPKPPKPALARAFFFGLIN
ncbi:MAG: hypothetical protein U9M92_01625 [Patescibacteria group bacterium]|nr:hypothetical protein [Patescibacteria group bacterium]